MWMFLLRMSDLGSFIVIEYFIDIGDLRLIKQCLWRIFVCFVDEEEKYLNKLFGVDVIEFLVFEWVLVFVLVRKKDGMFCWCVDY